MGAFHTTRCRERQAGGRGLLVSLSRSFPPASEREARMDDPTRWCENDASNGTRLPGLPLQSGGPTFLPPPRCESNPLFRPIDSNPARKTAHLVDFTIHGDSRLSQHVLDLRFAQSGCVIFK